MNEIDIIAPRWRDRTILLAEWKLGVMNKIIVRDKHFPQPLYISGEKVRKFPVEELKTKQGTRFTVRAVPISKFSTVPE